MKTVIVVPAYNEARTIAEVLRGLKREGWRSIIVVDDGSSDSTASLAEKEGAIVLRHVLNRGLGGALRTGIEGALQEGADIVVTFDADGQHDPRAIARLIQPIRTGYADVVVGSRLLAARGMPWYRIAQNWVGNVLTWVLFGVWCSDSQSGLRALSRRAAQTIEIRTNRMEVSSEIIGEIGRHRLRLIEIPIKPIYTTYSLSKGQSLMTGLKTLARLLLRKVVG